jgi:outer membrane receptor protein involved in Fe transport
LNTQSLHGFNNTTPVSQDIKTTFLLPSVNASYNFTERSLLRAAYGKTLNRPEFRELAPFYFYDNENNAGIYGSLYQSLFNPKGKNLKVAEIQNFDLRYEFYPSSGEMIHIGGFYKTFTNPIQRVIIPGGDVTDFTFVNCEKAYTYGAEIDVRKNLEFADRLFQTNIFKDFTVVANGALIKSELSFGDSTFDGQYTDMPNPPLQAQSPYIANAGLYYQNDNIGIKGSFLYNVFGPRIYSYGLGGQIPHLWERSLNTSDVNIEKTFFKHYILNLGVQNLFDARYATTYDLNGDHKINGNEPSSNWKDLRRGRYYTVGVKIRF